MDTTLFRARLRKAIYDEDVRVEFAEIQRENGTLEISTTAMIGKNGSAVEEFNLLFATYPTYNDLLYQLSSKPNWVVSKSTECVGTKAVQFIKFPPVKVDTAIMVYSNHFFHDSELDDFLAQSLAIWNESITPYESTAAFPEAKAPMLVWCAASLALMVRAAQDSVSLYQYKLDGRISSISLGGDLSISRNATPDQVSTLSWKSLADWYESKWRKFLESTDDGSDLPEIQEVEKVRILRETGTWPRKLDQGLPAVKNFSASVNADTVTLDWDRLFTQQFYAYKVMRDGVQVGIIYDNQVHEFEDLLVPAGNHLYSIIVLNQNMIESPANTLSVTV